MAERDLTDELLKAQVRRQLFGQEHAPRIGRWVILAPLGEGGMGTVFAAYDPKLDRKVAVKILRGEKSTRERVLREARLLGKLNHPNVVTVYDAVEVDEVISIVMELAPGKSLRHWIGDGRPWREVLATLQQIADGLAAVHRAGVVHRDVKPDNIVIGLDRPRLVDFGVASTSGDAPERSGTPGYVAPEVLAGMAATPASDQYGFGVTVFEALHGHRPPGTRRKVPGWVSRLVERTLAQDPSKRFPSMDDIARQMGHDRRVRRSTLLLGSAGLVLAAAAGYQQGKSRDECGGGEARVAAAFTPADIASIRANLGNAPWAKKTGDDFVHLLDTWSGSHRRVCEATRVHRGQTEAQLELRMRCLDRRFDRLRALAAALAAPLDPSEKENVAGAIASLPRPERCESLADASELPEALRGRAQQEERRLDRAWVAYSLGRYRVARDLAMELEKDTRDLRVPPFRAALLLLLGSAEARLGMDADAQTHLRTALEDAAAGHADAVTVEVWARLLRSELFDGSPARALEWAPFARAAVARAGAGASEIDGIEAEACRATGDLGRAQLLLKRALGEKDELRGDQRALLEMNLGSVELARGRPAAAEAAFTRAFELAEAALGPGHPGLGLYLDKLAAVARVRGRIAIALERHARALRLRREAYGHDDRAVATSLLRRARTLVEAGKLADAERDLQRARAIRVRVHGAAHRRLGEIDLARGDAAAARGDRRAASELYLSAAKLDPELEVAARLSEVGAPAELKRRDSISLDAVRESALRIERVPEAASDAAALLAAWRALGKDVAPELSNAVGRAELAVGHRREAAMVFRAALATLSSEPSRTRLAALEGLARAGDRTREPELARLRAAMPELR
ncbi:MAG: serine/threonine-protein kinase [Polyangiaceae bacterium]